MPEYFIKFIDHNNNNESIIAKIVKEDNYGYFFEKIIEHYKKQGYHCIIENQSCKVFQVTTTEKSWYYLYKYKQEETNLRFEFQLINVNKEFTLLFYEHVYKN